MISCLCNAEQCAGSRSPCLPRVLALWRGLPALWRHWKTPEQDDWGSDMLHTIDAAKCTALLL